ncbi:MAG: cyclic nucleotide-binding domain-containing protein, partial [Chloroflexi bacterium]|nr:cyclic nucleotide-binding domain-containing protein [Chloroflexota bacterium]
MPHEKELAAISIFSRLEKDDLERLGKSVVQRKYAKGDVIVKEGEQAVAFYVIVSGRVDVTKGGDKVGEKRAGEPFGEMALLDGYPRSTTVIAAEDTECLVMTRWDFTAELKTG